MGKVCETIYTDNQRKNMATDIALPRTWV